MVGGEDRITAKVGVDIPGFKPGGVGGFFLDGDERVGGRGDGQREGSGF